MVLANKETFSGHWKEGVRSGMGEMTWKDGSTYEGEWDNDMMNGEGTYERKGFRKYTGSWKASGTYVFI